VKNEIQLTNETKHLKHDLLLHQIYYIFLFLFDSTEGASDFQLITYYGSNNFMRGHASFDFQPTHFSSSNPWDGFTVCFWVKHLSVGAGQKVSYLTYFNDAGTVVFRVKYELRNDELSLLGWNTDRYFFLNIYLISHLLKKVKKKKRQNTSSYKI